MAIYDSLKVLKIASFSILPFSKSFRLHSQSAIVYLLPPLSSIRN